MHSQRFSHHQARSCSVVFFSLSLSRNVNILVTLFFALIFCDFRLEHEIDLCNLDLTKVQLIILYFMMMCMCAVFIWTTCIFVVVVKWFFFFHQNLKNKITSFRRLLYVPRSFHFNYMLNERKQILGLISLHWNANRLMCTHEMEIKSK